MSRIEFQRRAEPELVAEVRLYATAEGGRSGPILPGYGCPVMVRREEPFEGWDAILLLRDEPLHPGETRRIGFVFLSGVKAAERLRAAGRFYLWEGGFFGEAVVAD